MAKDVATFISFRTDPDQDKAAWVQSELKKKDISVTPLHGGELCPYGPEEPRKARAWISKFLKERIKHAQTLVVICSAVALKSEWVYLEYSEAMSKVRAIFLLWIDGADPTEYFCPDPRWLTRRLPSCSVYLVDLRRDSNRGVSRLADVLRKLRNAQYKLRLRQFVIVLALALFFGVAIYVANQVIPGFDSTDAAVYAAAVNNLKTFGSVCLAIVCCAAAFVFPTAYLVPNEYRRDPFFKRLVRGGGLSRYGGMIFSVLLLFGMQLGVIAMGVLGAILGVLCNSVRKMSISHALDKLERKSGDVLHSR